MPFCPRCRFEYRPGIRRCPECGAALVDRLPPEPSFPAAPDPEVIARVEATALLVTVSGEPHARLVQDALRAQGLVSRLEVGPAPTVIPWTLAIVTAAEHRAFDIYVRPEDLGRARQIYQDFEASARPDSRSSPPARPRPRRPRRRRW